MKEWLLVLKAADAAARWHVHHRRKGPAEERYINHLLEVAMLVAATAVISARSTFLRDSEGLNDGLSNPSYIELKIYGIHMGAFRYGGYGCIFCMSSDKFAPDCVSR
jgi:hypothetical protein